MTDPVLASLGVSDVSIERLENLVQMLCKWNPAINLVSRATLPHAWARHIIDSAQLFRLCPPKAEHWADLGSGGGYPGLVIAVLAAELRPELRVTMVEVDQRKATFLRQASLQLGLATRVEVARIEALAPLEADVLSARALASLQTLCGFAERHMAGWGVALFPKGAGWKAEVAEAQREWMFELDCIPSVTDAEAVILKLGKPRHV